MNGRWMLPYLLFGLLLVVAVSLGLLAWLLPGIDPVAVLRVGRARPPGGSGGGADAVYAGCQSNSAVATQVGGGWR